MNRILRIALIVFQAAWLNVVLPGHTRGVVTVPGYEPKASSSEHACCAAEEGSSNGDQRDSRERAKHCAVCFFAAKLTLPPVIDYSLSPLALLQTAPAIVPESADVTPPLLPFDGRGPPTLG